jgi:hypothetical protein
MKYVFISGPVTGRPDFNTQAFSEAAAAIRALGFVVFNPREIDRGDTTLPREHYMRICMATLVNQSSALVSLPQWSSSKGAWLERKVAEEIGIPVWNLGAFMKAHTT